MFTFLHDCFCKLNGISNATNTCYGAGFELVYGLDSATGFNVVVHRTEELLAPLGFEGSAPRLTSQGILATRGRISYRMHEPCTC